MKDSGSILDGLRKVPLELLQTPLHVNISKEKKLDRKARRVVRGKPDTFCRRFIASEDLFASNDCAFVSMMSSDHASSRRTEHESRTHMEFLHLLSDDAISLSRWWPIRCTVHILATTGLVGVVWLLEFDTALLATKVTLVGTSVPVMAALFGWSIRWRRVIWSAGVIVVIVRVIVTIWLNWRLVRSLCIIVRLALMSPAGHAVWL